MPMIERASALVARVFGSCMHFKHPSTVDVHPVVLKKIDFDITTEDIEKFDNNVENLQKFNGVPGVLCALKVDPSKGIDASEEDLKSRQDTFGSNTYPIKQNKPFLMFVWEALQDETLIILMACAAVALIVGLTTMDAAKGWYDGGGIAFAIVLVVLVSSTSNYKQSLQFQELNAEKRKIHINVTRQGRREKILIFDLVVGDIVHLGIGDQVPADGILIKGHSLVIDESSMTGESDPVSKDEEKPFFLSGCKVIDGFGVMLVTAVGMRTEWGKVMATLTEDDDEETPLQVRLNHLATIIGKIGMTVAIVVFLVLIIRLLASEVNFKHFTAENGRSIVDFFSVAVTIVVVAVPEGLPLAVTLALAYSMHKMMDDRALVRHLSACETMGSATTICSDKTGTLTQNVMTVVKSWVFGKLRDHTMLDHGLGDEHRKIFFDSLLNTNGEVTYTEGKDPEITGVPTEMAILKWGIKLGANFDKVKCESTILYVDAFNSSKKRMGMVIKKNSGPIWVHWKGAAEVILAKCNHFMDEDGSIASLTKEKLEELEGVISAFASAALRTICMACRDVSKDDLGEAAPSRKSIQIPDDGLTCIAIIGIKDPCRPCAPEAVRRCQLAGIKVRMVTGDNIMTAKAIAAECGILTKTGTAIEGPDFRVMSPEEQYKILPSVDIMARSSPTDKYLLVKRLLEMGEIVAVTGDGTNDAPALHEASIGLSMGIVGTEVAKESSDIIILDDNFSSIVKVVRWGRSVYVNIQKFIEFQCTVNGVALALNFTASVITGSTPLTAVQLLWVNLIMDTMGALALATESPTEKLMEKRPIRKCDSLITNMMWRNIFGQVFVFHIPLQ